MERLTIVRKPATAAENLYKYEVLETGEQFPVLLVTWHLHLQNI